MTAANGAGGPPDKLALSETELLEARLAQAAAEEAILSDNAPPPPPAPGDLQLVRTSLQLSADGNVSGNLARVFRRLEVRYPSGDFYVGEVVDGKREGRGTYYFQNGDIYVGEFVCDTFHGLGAFKKANFSINGQACVGRSYEGEFKDGLRCGRGVLRSGFGDTYDGSFVSDAFDGEGTMHYANGDVYSGYWSKGRRAGVGRLAYKSGAIYDGHWRNGYYDGEGTLMNSKKSGGGSFSGTWRAGLRHGIGKRIYSTGAEYEGDFEADERQGRGVYKSPAGDLYVGAFKANLYDGEGTLIMADGNRYQGEFVRGAFCGRGRLEYETGGFYEGEFLAKIRLGVTWRPMKKSINRWYWDAWNRMPKTHIYDPLTKKLLSVNGVRYVEGAPVEPEVKDPKKIPASKRLAQAEDVRRQRKEKEIAERDDFQKNLELMGGANRAKALERWKAKTTKQPEDFRPPIIVDSTTDGAWFRATEKRI